MRSMMESFERWSINGEPDAPRDASPVPREDCRNLCSKGIRRCFPTLLCGRVFLFLMGGRHRQQPPNAGSAQRGISGESGFCCAAADVYGRHISPPAEDEWPEFVQPTGAGTAYQVGDKVTFKGVHYICRLPHCVWSPADYPIGWQKQA